MWWMALVSNNKLCLTTCSHCRRMTLRRIEMSCTKIRVHISFWSLQRQCSTELAKCQACMEKDTKEWRLRAITTSNNSALWILSISAPKLHQHLLQAALLRLHTERWRLLLYKIRAQRAMPGWTIYGSKAEITQHDLSDTRWKTGRLCVHRLQGWLWNMLQSSKVK